VLCIISRLNVQDPGGLLISILEQRCQGSSAVKRWRSHFYSSWSARF